MVPKRHGYIPQGDKMSHNIITLDVIALTQDLPEQRLVRGQDAYEVEFVSTEGKTYTLLPLRAEQIMVLHYEPVPAAR
jgi:hypothetical protein